MRGSLFCLSFVGRSDFFGEGIKPDRPETKNAAAHAVKLRTAGGT